MKKTEAEMRKQEYLQKLARLGLDREKFCIVAGGAMVLHGIREETGDIDVQMSQEHFEEIKGRFETKKSPKYENLYEIGDKVEVMVGPFKKEGVVEKEGFLVNGLEQELKWKLEHGREKDLADIKRICEVLGLEHGEAGVGGVV